MMCLLCRQRVGAKIQCTSCYTAYHPLCARLAGLHMEILDGGESGEDLPVSAQIIRYSNISSTPYSILAAAGCG